MATEEPEKKKKKLPKALGWTKLVWHAFTTGPMAYVEEKQKEAKVTLAEHRMLQKNYRKLEQQQRLYKIFNYFWLLFTVVFYWALVQSIIAGGLKTIGVEIPSIVGTIVLILTPIAVPGLIVSSKLKTAMYNDMHNTKSYCLGYIARLAVSPEQKEAEAGGKQEQSG